MKKYIYEKYMSYRFPTNPDEFINYLEQLLLATKVPRHSIRIRIATKEEYGDSTAYLQLQYQREETLEEKEDRLAEEQRRELNDRSQYESLKKRFEKE